MNGTHLTPTGEKEDTKRFAFQVDGLTYYLIMDRKLCFVKYPFENREEDIKQRLALERMGEKVTEVLEMWAYEDYQAEEAESGPENPV